MGLMEEPWKKCLLSGAACPLVGPWVCLGNYSTLGLLLDAARHCLAWLTFVGNARRSWSDANNHLMPPTSQLGFLCCEGCGFLFCFAAFSSWDHLLIPGLLVKVSKLLLKLILCSVAEQSPLCSTCPTYSTKVIFLKTCTTSIWSLVIKRLLKTQIALEGLEWYWCHPSWQNH